MTERLEAVALRTFAASLETEATKYTRLLRLGQERSTSAETIRQCASLARQMAHQVDRVGLPAAASRIPVLTDEHELENAIEAACTEWFRSMHGRPPSLAEFNQRSRDAMRRAVLAAWPWLRIAQIKTVAETRD
ncbi:hypothetical protein [Xanthomonas arboricola]|uniref:hypothetical protein n=1 Tax=Xanthomonas arboricola TaxID=56448 RepID=UPI003EBB88F4